MPEATLEVCDAGAQFSGWKDLAIAQSLLKKEGQGVPFRGAGVHLRQDTDQAVSGERRRRTEMLDDVECERASLEHGARAAPHGNGGGAAEPSCFARQPSRGKLRRSGRGSAGYRETRGGHLSRGRKHVTRRHTRKLGWSAELGCVTHPKGVGKLPLASLQML